MVFHAQARLARGQGAKVTVPTFTAQSLVRPEIVHQLDREVGYYRAQKGKGKGKRKRNSPKQAKLEEEEATQAPPQIGEENVQGSEDVEATQTQDNPQVPPAKQEQGGDEMEVQEIPQQ